MRPTSHKKSFPANSGRKRFPHLLLRALVALLLFLPGVALPTQASYSQQLATGEYELKAVYLYNFLHFVQWPSELHEKESTFIIGVVGESPFGDAFDLLRQGLQQQKQQGISVIYFGPYRKNMDLGRCHLLFVSSSEHRNFQTILASLKGTPVLTVGDHEDFLASGGMINLVRYKEKLRWEGNRAPVRQTVLRFEAKLLDIATQIVDLPAPRNSERPEE